MTKLFALIAAGLLVAGAMFAGEHGDSAMQVGHKTKMACTIPLADLNLTPEQSKKMNAVMAEHMKTGCTDASEAKYMQEAKAILTAEQYAKFGAACH
jgi:Spy/CpxP family protein refolding chaperone